MIQNIEKYYRKKMELISAEKDAIIETQGKELERMRALVAEVTHDND